RLPGLFREHRGIAVRVCRVAVAGAFRVETEAGLEGELLAGVPARGDPGRHRPAVVRLVRAVVVEVEPDSGRHGEVRQQPDARLRPGAGRQAHVQRGRRGDDGVVRARALVVE